MSRKVAREVAFKVIFELAFQQDENAEELFKRLVETSEEKFETTEDDEIYVKEIVSGIQSNGSSLDEKIKSHLKDWSFERISKVDVAILRLAIYEMTERKDIPCKVSVNEAVELAKTFSEDASPAFINGVLAEIMKEVEK